MAEPAEEIVQLLPTPIKGKADWRTYRAFRLQNGVTCLVVHDKESKTTGMSCLVNVGASADPRSLSGLAHFCEHMCFLGSEKYPGENEYKRFLSSHGGQSNASTSMQVTNYKNEVLADHAEKALDMFSHFFVAPLFTLSGTAREVQAIDSENSKNLTADSRRRLQILKQLCDPDHWYSKFSTGNSKTLDTDSDPKRLEWVREALLAFHRKHYRPSNMTVVIAGPQSLDTLQEWIVTRYSKIPILKEKAPEDWTEIERLIEEAAAEAPPNSLDQPPPPFWSPFSPAQQGGRWPVLLTTRPLNSTRKLVLMWPIPSDDNHFPDHSASSFLSHLLGHEGVGSAFAVLQNHGMLSSLSAGQRTRAPDFTLFQVDMGLTEKGERHWKEVVDLVFAYCRLLQNQVELAESETSGGGRGGDMARIWGEMSRLGQMFFHQTSPGGVYSYAPNLAERILSYGTTKVLSAGSMLDQSENTFPLEKVSEAVKLLCPSNFIVERCSQEAWGDVMSTEKERASNGTFGLKKEQWYGVEYHLSSIGQDVVDSWEDVNPMPNEMKASELSLPRPNQYIPRTLDLCPELPDAATQGPRLDKSIEPPQLLIEDEMGRLFHRLDDRYALPQSSLTLLIRNAAVQNIKTGIQWEYDDRAALLSSLLSGVFSEAMAQETYDAHLAGLRWSLSLGSSGIKLSFFGFSDRLPDLGLKILGEFLSGLFIDPRYFESTKDRVIRSLQTYFESRRADSHAMYYRDALLASKDGGIEESLNLAIEAKLEDVQRHFETILSNHEISLECLFSGNVSENDAATFYNVASSSIQKATKMTFHEISPRPPNAIPSGFVERRINIGEDIELHFASKNPEEENGAVICSYQSSIPAYKGDGISHPLGLKSSAAIRLISHMLREPLFDDLRTKQQLGYIVSAYYEQGYSSRPNQDLVTLGPLTTPVDFITVVVLSRKLSPPDIVQRIDDFMSTFRESLVHMPASEIQDHAEALSTKLLKPIAKLETEASNHFGKISRYAPELFYNFHKDGLTNNRNGLEPTTPTNNRNGLEPTKQLPWDNAQSLSTTLRSLTREDLLETWDRMTHPSARSRIVSCVYGNTFPLATTITTTAKATKSSTESSTLPLPIRSTRGWTLATARHPSIKVVNNFSDILRQRKKLLVFNDQATKRSFPMKNYFSSWISCRPSLSQMSVQPPPWAKFGFGCAAIGVGMVGIALAFRNQRRANPQR